MQCSIFSFSGKGAFSSPDFNLAPLQNPFNYSNPIYFCGTPTARKEKAS